LKSFLITPIIIVVFALKLICAHLKKCAAKLAGMFTKDFNNREEIENKESMFVIALTYHDDFEWIGMR
jgi:hypothetical protein